MVFLYSSTPESTTSPGTTPSPATSVKLPSLTPALTGSSLGLPLTRIHRRSSVRAVTPLPSPPPPPVTAGRGPEAAAGRFSSMGTKAAGLKRRAALGTRRTSSLRLVTMVQLAVMPGNRARLPL